MEHVTKLGKDATKSIAIDFGSGFTKAVILRLFTIIYKRVIVLRRNQILYSEPLYRGTEIPLEE